MPDTASSIERTPPGLPTSLEDSIRLNVVERAASVEAITSTNEEANREAEQVFSRKHGDGQEYSGTVEQARRVCTALGRMTVENARATLQDDDLAARVAQRGREKRLANASKTDENKKEDKRVSADGDSSKLEAKRTNHNEGSERITETILARAEYGHEHETYRRGVISTQPVDPKDRQTPPTEPTYPEHQSYPHRQAEVARLTEEALIIRDETLSGMFDEVAINTTQKSEITPSPSNISVAEKLEMAIQNGGVLNQYDESAKGATTAQAAVEVATDNLFVNRLSELQELLSGTPEQNHFESVTNRNEQQDFTTNLVGPLNDAPKEQAGIETVQLSMSNEDEFVSQQQSLGGYELLNEDEVIWLMARFQQSTVEINPDADFSLAVPLVGDPTETTIRGLSAAEYQKEASLPELPAPIGEIESAIGLLTAELEYVINDENQKAYQILAEIIRLPDTAEARPANVDRNIDQQLEGLFIELFEQTGVEYTSRVIESFVILTKMHYLKELIPIAIEPNGDAPTIADDVGTREFLQKLQQGLSAMQKAVIHFYEIGKSILRLYGIANAIPE